MNILQLLNRLPDSQAIDIRRPICDYGEAEDSFTVGNLKREIEDAIKWNRTGLFTKKETYLAGKNEEARKYLFGNDSKSLPVVQFDDDDMRGVAPV